MTKLGEYLIVKSETSRGGQENWSQQTEAE